jgi:plastocyanin
VTVRRITTPGALTALLAALALSLAACGDSDNSTVAPQSSTGSDEGSKATVAGLEANDHGTKDVTGMDELEVEVDDYYFSPTVLKGDPGQQITLEITNETNSTEHNFTLADQALTRNIEQSGTVRVKVTFPESGTLSFFCKFHKSIGMAGGLNTSGSVATGGGSSPDDSGSTGEPPSYGNY